MPLHRLREYRWFQLQKSVSLSCYIYGYWFFETSQVISNWHSIHDWYIPSMRSRELEQQPEEQSYRQGFHIFVIWCISIIAFWLGWLGNQIYLTYFPSNNNQTIWVWHRYELEWTMVWAVGQWLFTFLSKDMWQVLLMSTSIDISKYNWDITIDGVLERYEWTIPVINVNRAWKQWITTDSSRRYDDKQRVAIEKNLWHPITDTTWTIAILDPIYKKTILSIISEKCWKECWAKFDEIAQSKETFKTSRWFYLKPNKDQTQWSAVVWDRIYYLRTRDIQSLYNLTPHIQFVTNDWIKWRISQRISALCAQWDNRILLVNSINIKEQNWNVFATVYGQWEVDHYVCRIRIISHEWSLWFSFINIIQW